MTNKEKFFKNPYKRIPVMLLVSTFLGFFGWVFATQVLLKAPIQINGWEDLWIIPTLVMSYAWASAFVISLVLIFKSEPIKKAGYDIRGAGTAFLLYGGIVGLVVAPILIVLCVIVSDNTLGSDSTFWNYASAFVVGMWSGFCLSFFSASVIVLMNEFRA